MQKKSQWPNFFVNIFYWNEVLSLLYTALTVVLELDNGSVIKGMSALSQSILTVLSHSQIQQGQEKKSVLTIHYIRVHYNEILLCKNL